MWKTLCVIFISLLLTILLPFIAILLCPILLYRLLVKVSAGWLKPNFERILSPLSSLVACNDVYQDQIRSGSISVTLNGRVDFDQICDSFQEKVINSRNPNGELIYPELQQKIEKWLGYYFWEYEKDFDVKANHVQVWNSENSNIVVTQESFKGIVNQILKTEFEWERSPWKLYIVNNTRLSSDPPGVGNKTTLIFHFHHVLGGGTGKMAERIFQPWYEGNQTESVETDTHTQVPNEVQQHQHHLKFIVNWRLILAYVKILFCGPYACVSEMVEKVERIEWSSKSHWDKGIGDLNVDISETLPISLFRDIRAIYGTSFVSIILGAYAGALRRFMIQHLIKVTSEIHCSIPMDQKFLIEGSPVTDNCSSSMVVKLPIQNEIDPLSPKERILLIQKRLRQGSSSTGHLTNAFLDIILGTFPSCLVGKFLSSRHRRSPGTKLINISGPTERKILCNKEVIGIFPLEKSPSGLQGPALLCNTYSGSVQFILSGDSTLMPLSLPLKDLNTFIFKELTDLIRLDVVLYV